MLNIYSNRKHRKATEPVKEIVKSDCPSFDNCNAPLCPLDPSSLDNGVFYADEEVCRGKKFQSLPWIRTQKKIARLGLTIDDGYFSHRMLTSIRVVTKNLKGADPDDFDSEEKWLKERLEKRATVSQKRGNSKASNKQMGGNSIAKKRKTLVGATIQTSKQRKEVSYV